MNRYAISNIEYDNDIYLWICNCCLTIAVIRDNSPVLGVTVPESLGEWVAGDLELGYLKHETLIAACLHEPHSPAVTKACSGCLVSSLVLLFLMEVDNLDKLS